MADAIHNRNVAIDHLGSRGLTDREAVRLLGRSKREIAVALFDACSLLNDAGSCDDVDSTIAKMHELLARVADERKES